MTSPCSISMSILNILLSNHSQKDIVKKVLRNHLYLKPSNAVNTLDGLSGTTIRGLIA